MKGFHSSPTLKAARQLHKQNSGTVEEPGGAQAGVILSLASKQLSARRISKK